MAGNLSKLFSPKSVAVVGASREANKIGGIVVKNILDSGYKGLVYPVNPKAEKIEELKCYPDYSSLPKVPDLAVVAIPAQFVIEALEQVGEKGTKNVVVFSAGFKEIGDEGEELERQLVEVARKYEINLLGPNCLGFVNNLTPVNVTFGQVVSNPGNLRFVSQSGAIASSIFDWFEATGLGFSEFVTLGNKSVISENEVLEYWLGQKRDLVEEQFGKGLSGVWPVGLYLESIVDGKKFMELVAEIVKLDPVFVLKPGKSEAAAKAMQSHTGALAGEDAVFDQALAQVGAIRCESLEDMFELSRAFAWEVAPKGPRVVVVSNAGGPAVISADAVGEVGLELAPIDDGTLTQLREHLPRAASVKNPVDVLGDALAQRYADAIEIVMKEERVDALVVILTPQVMTQIEETAELIAKASAKYPDKPIMCSFMGGTHVAAGEEILNKARIPSFRFPERAIKAVAAMWKWRETSNKEQVILQGSSGPSAIYKQKNK